MRQDETIIAICDDDCDFLKAFAAQVRETMGQLNVKCTIRAYSSAEALLDDVRNGKMCSVLILDVMMDGLDGMALARALRKDAIDIPVIFVSNNRETALYGYELDALRFLAKPVESARLREALLAAVQKLQTQALAIQTADGLYRVDIRNIRYAEMLRRGVSLRLRDGTALSTHMKISEFELALPQNRFFRCHQGYIVNMDAISTILRTDVVLEDGSRVPISRYRLAELRERFLSYLNE